jgi:hypothetical protein
VRPNPVLLGHQPEVAAAMKVVGDVEDLVVDLAVAWELAGLEELAVARSMCQTFVIP